MLEAAPDGLALIDRGSIAYVNRRFEVLTGYSRTDLLGRPIDLLLADPPAARQAVDSIRSHLGGARATPVEGLAVDVVREDGRVVPVEVSLSPLKVGTSEMTAASVRDISPLRRADRARQRLLNMLDLDPDAVFIVDAVTARIEYANTGAVNLLGYSKEQLTTMTMYDLSPTASPDGLQQVLAEHRRHAPGHQHMIEVVRRSAAGHDIPCDSRGQIILDDDGSEKFVVVDRDSRGRMAAESQRLRRGELSSLLATITTLVLSDAPSEAVYHHAVEGTARLLRADNASLVLHDDLSNSFVTVGGVGPAARLHFDKEVALSPEVMAEFTRPNEAFSIDGPPDGMPDAIRDLAGPGVIAPFPGSGPRRGVLTAFRAKGGDLFDPFEISLIDDLASQIATVIELGHARDDQHRLTILEDRQRIARDLHDTIIQDLIAIGIQLTVGLDLPAHRAVRERDSELIDQLDETVRRLRTVVFETRAHGPADLVVDSIGATVAESARALGHRPSLSLRGDLDELSPLAAEHLVAVLREALSNVARHSGARATSVTVGLSDTELVLEVADDGCGPGRGNTAGIGLLNMAQRAALMGGTMALSGRPGGGSLLRWTARVRAVGS